MTGDWEIFRLGEVPQAPEADPNLSRGVGVRVFDVMPSRSPDFGWIAFTSNRDGNWEIYISSITDDEIRRVTHNTQAIDLDPVWSPMGDAIIYESQRGDNWDLYLFDLNTGEERQLTFSQGNDVNAFWAHNGSRIVYQSDRDGFWQVYELNVTTLVERLLSDGVGDDHAPEYSNDDQHIAFRSYRDGNNSVVYSMDADGANVTRISDPAGNALNHSWAPDDQLIGYESNMDGDDDIYVYDLGTETTRKVTENETDEYAPTWVCGAPVLVFTSNVTEDSNLFQASALPIEAASIDVMGEAQQITFDPESDQFPLDSPSEENASRSNSLPSPVKNR
jgi:TolB protein